MGSMEGSRKGEMPFLNQIKEHNKRHEQRMFCLYLSVLQSAPLWRQIADDFGWHAPLNIWMLNAMRYKMY